jgi:hypothetical protein
MVDVRKPILLQPYEEVIDGIAKFGGALNHTC